MRRIAVLFSIRGPLPEIKLPPPRPAETLSLDEAIAEADRQAGGNRNE